MEEATADAHGCINGTACFRVLELQCGNITAYGWRGLVQQELMHVFLAVRLSRFSPHRPSGGCMTTSQT